MNTLLELYLSGGIIYFVLLISILIHNDNNIRLIFAAFVMSIFWPIITLIFVCKGTDEFLSKKQDEL